MYMLAYRSRQTSKEPTHLHVVFGGEVTIEICVPNELRKTRILLGNVPLGVQKGSSEGRNDFICFLVICL